MGSGEVLCYCSSFSNLQVRAPTTGKVPLISGRLPTHAMNDHGTIEQLFPNFSSRGTPERSLEVPRLLAVEQLNPVLWRALCQLVQNVCRSSLDFDVSFTLIFRAPTPKLRRAHRSFQTGMSCFRWMRLRWCKFGLRIMRRRSRVLPWRGHF